MKIAASIIAVLAAMPLICSCSSKSEDTKAQTNAPQAVAVADENLMAQPDGEYQQLTEEAEEHFDYISDAADELFPDAKGKRMYGFTGVEEIETSDGEKSCYVFDFYTYKTKSEQYCKIATIAKADDSDDIYLLDESTGEYVIAELPDKDVKWYEQATAALAVNTNDTAADEIEAE